MPGMGIAEEGLAESGPATGSGFGAMGWIEVGAGVAGPGVDGVAGALFPSAALMIFTGASSQPGSAMAPPVCVDTK